MNEIESICRFCINNEFYGMEVYENERIPCLEWKFPQIPRKRKCKKFVERIETDPYGWYP